MKICYLRTSAGTDAKAALAAFEKSGCQQTVVDSTPVSDRRNAAFEAVLARLSGGDTLVVWTLASAASSLEGLVSLICSLMEKNIAFESLTEQFSTAGKSRASIAATFDHLRRFKDEIKKSHYHRGLRGHRIGRPRALNEREIEKARMRVVKMGEAIDVVARDLGVSRATLYRYIDAEP